LQLSVTASCAIRLVGAPATSVEEVWTSGESPRRAKKGWRFSAGYARNPAL